MIYSTLLAFSTRPRRHLAPWWIGFAEWPPLGCSSRVVGRFGLLVPTPLKRTLQLSPGKAVNSWRTNDHSKHQIGFLQCRFFFLSLYFFFSYATPFPPLFFCLSRVCFLFSFLFRGWAFIILFVFFFSPFLFKLSWVLAADLSRPNFGRSFSLSTDWRE